MGHTLKASPPPRAAISRTDLARRQPKPERLRRTRSVRLRLGEGGRFVIPAEIRERLGLEVGKNLVLTIEGDRAILRSISTALREVQEWARRVIPPGVSLSEELMAERKQEAERE
jgi:AbrB family looped-hinge helix DNA binding protein